MWDFRTFGAMPDPGALLDQPAGLLRRMRYAEQVWQVYDSFNRAASWQRWQTQYPDAWELKVRLDKLREQARETPYAH